MTLIGKSTDPVTGIVTLLHIEVRCDRACLPGERGIRLTSARQEIKDDELVVHEHYACARCFPDEKELTHLSQKWVGFKRGQMTAINLSHPPTKEIEEFLKKHGVKLEYYIRGGGTSKPDDG